VTGTGEALEVARAYHNAWTSGDVERAGRCLADTLETEVPINHYDGKAQFLEAVRGFAQLVSNVNMLAACGNEDQALLLYEMNVETIGPFRIAEHFTVEDGVIVRIRHVHDTAALRAAGFADPNR
jgi:ketosteroid isomerase-like protein